MPNHNPFAVSPHPLRTVITLCTRVAINHICPLPTWAGERPSHRNAEIMGLA